MPHDVMYTGLVCLVLFDARGTTEFGYEIPCTCLVALVLCIKYIPVIFHRPQYVDEFCEDILHLGTHASLVAMLPKTNHLQYACMLHCMCFLLQHRFVGKTPVLVHTITAIWLLAAYLQGPRVSELQTFISAIACPHLFEMAAVAVVQMQRFVVLYFITQL